MLESSPDDECIGIEARLTSQLVDPPTPRAAAARYGVELFYRRADLPDAALTLESDKMLSPRSFRSVEWNLHHGPRFQRARRCCDNALAETINGLYKAEVIHRRSWQTRAPVELATLEWVAWLNHHRLLGPIGYIPPAEAEANYYRQLASQTSTVQV